MVRIPRSMFYAMTGRAERDSQQSDGRRIPRILRQAAQLAALRTEFASAETERCEFLLRVHAFEYIGGLAGKHVEPREVALGGLVNPPPMRR